MRLSNSANLPVVAGVASSVFCGVRKSTADSAWPEPMETLIGFVRRHLLFHRRRGDSERVQAGGGGSLASEPSLPRSLLASADGSVILATRRAGRVRSEEVLPLLAPISQ